MNEDALLKNKIPGDHTGIEIKKTVCDICSPSCHCGVDAYVKDGVIIKVEGTKGHPFNDGVLCTKGCAGRQYIYRPDRIKTPLLRTGEKGEGKFEEITWDRAFDIITEKLGAYRDAGEASAVAFYSGYSKWYRPWLKRLCHLYGSQSFGTESSACATSRNMAWQLTAGTMAAPDLKNARLFLGWALNPYYSNHMQAKKLTELKRQGLKIIVVDPRITPASEKLADLYLRPRPGTDGALALAIGNELIKNGWINSDYIAKYVRGFEDYRAYASGFNETKIEALTGVPYEGVRKAAEMIHEAGVFAMKENPAALSHHRCGFQTYRAVIALLAITGSFDVSGGQLPIKPTFNHVSAGFTTREKEFSDGLFPEGASKAVGSDRFPLWYHLRREMQAMDLGRQIIEEKPYPVRALFACGLNERMFPDTERFLAALKKLSFIVNVDMFMTDACKYADLVLPACSSFERGEIKVYGGGYAAYTTPAIEPLYESRSDAEIICELSRRLGLDDELLNGGYEKGARFILSGLPVTVEELKKSPLPVKIPGLAPYEPGSELAAGLKTGSGKIELSSALLEKHPEWNIEPLPVWSPPIPEEEREKYPFVLCSGGSIPGGLHSRLHDVPWLRSLRPDALAEIAPADGEKLGIKDGDKVELFNDTGAITLKAHITCTVPEGTVFTYHGYREANIEQLIPADALDPASGFPAYRSVGCHIRRVNS